MFPQLAQHCYLTHIKAVLLLDIPSLPGASGAIRGEDRGSARSANSRGATKTAGVGSISLPPLLVVNPVMFSFRSAGVSQIQKTIGH